MTQRPTYDAIVVGSGPNGLSAAITIAQEGYKVLVVEGMETIGGGLRSAELTLPGFVHDPCAAIFPLSRASPFLRQLPLEEFGLEWLHSPFALAHPLDGGRVMLVERSLERTAERLGKTDGQAYRRLLGPLLADWERFSQDLLGPLPLPPRSITSFLRFTFPALSPATFLARRLFGEPETRALFAGVAGHAIMPIDALATAAYGIVILLTAHSVGWPFPRGGAQSFSNALAAYFTSLGGEIVNGLWVHRMKDLPPAKAVLFDVTPRQLLSILGEKLPAGYQRDLRRYRYGPGVFKIDYALDGPIPWKASQASQAATLHLGGTMEEIAASERLVWRGEHPERPYVLVAQPSLFDPTRSPAGKHTAWAYCHVPHGSTFDMTGRIEAQLERFAPGFRDLILGRHTRNPAEMEAYNPNYVGGDINGGVQDLRQLYARPVMRRVPYSTPLSGIYLCSSSTPPGGGAHGMSGHYAARAALKFINGTGEN